MKDKTIIHLVERLKEEGIIRATTIPGARSSVQNWINRGVLQLRQDVQNRYYLVTQEEIEEIVKSFSSGGKGYYHARI